MNVLSAWLERLVQALWLSVLWLVSCLPVVTIPAATVALVGTAEDIQRGEADHGTARTFIRHLRRSAGLSTLVGGAWAVLVGVLVIDFVILRVLEEMRLPLYVVLVTLTLGMLAVTAFLPHVVRHGPHGVVASARQALLITLARPFDALQSVLAACVAFFGVLTMPLLVFVLPALAAHASVLAWRRAGGRLLESADGRGVDAQLSVASAGGHRLPLGVVAGRTGPRLGALRWRP